MSATPLTIIEKSLFTADILCLKMQGENPIDFSAGQYILLGTDPDNLKPFSIAAAPTGDGTIECHIRSHDDSGWMQALFAKDVGDTLYFVGPNNQMALQDNLFPTIFVAGGTGFAPMRALLEALLKTQPIQPIHFYWGARKAEDLYQDDLLKQLSAQYENLNYVPVLSEEDDSWQGRTGFVHEAVLSDYPVLEHHQVYLCGPWPMVQTAKEQFIAAGLTEQNFVS